MRFEIDKDHLYRCTNSRSQISIISNCLTGRKISFTASPVGIWMSRVDRDRLVPSYRFCKFGVSCARFTSLLWMFHKRLLVVPLETVQIDVRPSGKNLERRSFAGVEIRFECYRWRHDGSDACPRFKRPGRYRRLRRPDGPTLVDDGVGTRPGGNAVLGVDHVGTAVHANGKIDASGCADTDDQIHVRTAAVCCTRSANRE